MTFLLPAALGGLFALLAPLIVANFLLRAVFLVRPPPPIAQKSFFAASTIGTLLLIPPMFFVGFVLFSAMSKSMPVASAPLSSASQYLLGSLALLGLLAQLLLGQRLSLVTDRNRSPRQRLIVERVVSGTVHDWARDDIASIALYRNWINYRHRKIELHLKDGSVIRLAFGETIQSDLATWLDTAPS